MYRVKALLTHKVLAVVFTHSLVYFVQFVA